MARSHKLAVTATDPNMLEIYLTFYQTNSFILIKVETSIFLDIQAYNYLYLPPLESEFLSIYLLVL